MSDQEITFTIDKEQSEKFRKWRKEQDEKVAKKQGKEYAYYGAIGGGYTFRFTDTFIGTMVFVKNAITEEEINLSGDL